jgi:hypothetical protein
MTHWTDVNQAKPFIGFAMIFEWSMQIQVS